MALSLRGLLQVTGTAFGVVTLDADGVHLALLEAEFGVAVQARRFTGGH